MAPSIKIALVALGIALPAQAQEGTVSQFNAAGAIVEKCASKAYFEQGYCMGYIIGIIDVLSVSGRCQFDGITAKEVHDGVVEAINGLPEMKDMAAGGIIGSIITQDFCNGRPL